MKIKDLQGLEGFDLNQLADVIASKLGESGRNRLGGSSSQNQDRKKKRKSVERRIQFLIDEELAGLFQAIHDGGSNRDLAIFELAYHRGLRASEVGKLEMRHLRLSQKRLYVTRMKHSESREYPLSEREVKALRGWLRLRGSEAGPIFPSRNHRPIGRRRLDQLMKHYGQVAGIPDSKRHFHCLRHSCGTSLVDRDVDIRIIQDHLGHADIRNTMIYTSVSDRKRKQTIEKLRDW
jgi:type 1 fimbriae regulatory protein FimB